MSGDNLLIIDIDNTLSRCDCSAAMKSAMAAGGAALFHRRGKYCVELLELMSIVEENVLISKEDMVVGL